MYVRFCAKKRHAAKSQPQLTSTIHMSACVCNTHLCEVCVSRLLPNAITITPYTCLCSYTPLTEFTNRRRRDHGFLDPERHLCATTNARTSQKHRLRHLGLSPLLLRGCVRVIAHSPGNSKDDHGLLSSAAHMCVCAITDHGLGSMLMPQTCARV